jgi:hypothetical protein
MGSSMMIKSPLNLQAKEGKAGREEGNIKNTMIFKEKYNIPPISSAKILTYYEMPIGGFVFLGFRGPFSLRWKMENLKKILKIYVYFKDRAFSAYLHFLAPALLFSSLTDGSIYEPAEMTHSKLPCRAGFPLLPRAFQDLPAGAKFPARLLLHSQQEEHLPFDMDRDFSPTLLKCLNRPDGDSQ